MSQSFDSGAEAPSHCGDVPTCPMPTEFKTFAIDSSSPLVGAVVFLDRTIDRRRPCCANTGVIIPGTEPHAAGIVCADCGRHRGWLPRTTVSKLREIIERFGMPSEPLIVRDQSSHFACD